jgi:hypothetical protein
MPNRQTKSVPINRMLLDDLEADIKIACLKAAKSNGGVHSTSVHAGMGENSLWEQINRSAGVLARTIPLVTAVTNNDEPLRALCEPCGYIPVKVPTKGTSCEIIEQIIMSQITHQGEVVSEYMRARSKGSSGGERITQEEARRILSVIDDWIADILALRIRIKKEAGGA